jgi:hypothetical protein
MFERRFVSTLINIGFNGGRKIDLGQECGVLFRMPLRGKLTTGGDWENVDSRRALDKLREGEIRIVPRLLLKKNI